MIVFLDFNFPAEVTFIEMQVTPLASPAHFFMPLVERMVGNIKRLI
jgi:hypothetical protein